MKLRIFQEQVRDQSQAVLVAAEQISQALATGDNRRLFLACQNLLAGAANVSKMLWSQNGKRTDERRVLRESLGVADDSPLKSRAMRNHLEHLDERIDAWWDTSTSHNYVDRMIGPPESIGGFSDGDQFRVYDPTRHQMVFLGTRYDIIPLVDEAKRLLPIAHAEASKPHWPSD